MRWDVFCSRTAHQLEAVSPRECGTFPTSQSPSSQSLSSQSNSPTHLVLHQCSTSGVRSPLNLAVFGLCASCLEKSWGVCCKNVEFSMNLTEFCTNCCPLNVVSCFWRACQAVRSAT